MDCESALAMTVARRCRWVNNKGDWYEKVVFGFERGDAGVSSRLVQNDRHQCGGIDGDHPGSPSSPYRKS
jgi:hypothetical protein